MLIVTLREQREGIQMCRARLLGHALCVSFIAFLFLSESRSLFRFLLCFMFRQAFLHRFAELRRFARESWNARAALCSVTSG